MKIALWIVLLCLFAVRLWGQAKQPSAEAPRAACQAYFQVVQVDARIAGGFIAGGNEAQRKWWEKKGRRKYPGMCWDGSVLTAEKPRYVLIWVSESHSKLVDVPTSETSEQPVTGTVTDTDGQTVGTISGTTTTTTIRDQVLQRNWTTASISVLGVTPENKLEPSPVYFYTAGPGFLQSYVNDRFGVNWSSESQKALEAALKFLVGKG